MTYKISVIMPVHAGIKSKFFCEAVHSILNQSLKALELIIVVDGKTSDELLKKIIDFSSYDSIFVIYLSKNHGAGFARDAGINSSNGDIIALMDADDISRSNRFEIQINSLISNENDMLGGYISEFYNEIGDFHSIRKVPNSMLEIKQSMARRMPFNNVTLMFTKELYLRSGGYKSFRHIEDYDLNFRMFMNANSVSNLRKVLVDVRLESDGSIHKRRVGWNYFIEEQKLFYLMYRAGYIGIYYYLFSMLVRSIIRLGPVWLSKYIYLKLRG